MEELVNKPNPLRFVTKKDLQQGKEVFVTAAQNGSIFDAWGTINVIPLGITNEIPVRMSTGHIILVSRENLFVEDTRFAVSAQEQQVVVES